MKHIFVMLGLPASGKTTWIDQNVDPSYQRVSADDIKVTLDHYDPLHPDIVHQQSVQLAKQELGTLVSSGSNIVWDAGSINNKYTESILTAIKLEGYHITLVHINTPVSICLQRNATRERIIPPNEIIKKSIRLNRCLSKLLLQKGLIGDYQVVNYYTSKIVIVDMDGTVAAYQYLPKDQHGGINFVDGEYFRWALPVVPMIDSLKKDSESHQICVLSAIPDSFCEAEKNEWLDTWMPFVRDRFFVGNKVWKMVMLRNLAEKYKWSQQDITIIDDDHRILDTYNEAGFHAIHPSLYLAKGL